MLRALFAHNPEETQQCSVIVEGDICTLRMTLSSQDVFVARYGSACLMNIEVVPSGRENLKIPRYTKFAVPPDSRVSAVQAY
jgi:hypothetical protein